MKNKSSSQTSLLDLKYKDPLLQYSYLVEIGKGSYGTVYKAVDKESDQVVAIKEMKVTNTEQAGSAVIEFYTMNTLPKHDNVVTFHKCIHEDYKEARVILHAGQKEYLKLLEHHIKGKAVRKVERSKLRFVMDFCDAGDMNDFLLTRKPNAKLNASFIRQLANGVAFLHDNRVVHRDLKPENVFLRHNKSSPDIPICKIGDFGLAKVCVKLEKNKSKVTPLDDVLLESACGSDYFMAPEVFNEKYNVKADIFSLGTIFWAMIDRITLREISEGKLLLLAYIMRDNSVTPLGSALYDDGSIDIGQLLDATSNVKPIFYKEKGDQKGYSQGKDKEEGGTCVEGDHFVIRKLIQRMISPIPDNRPDSRNVVLMLEECLKAPPTNKNSLASNRNHLRARPRRNVQPPSLLNSPACVDTTKKRKANKRPTELNISSTPLIAQPVTAKTPVNPTYLTIKELSCYASPIVPDVDLMSNDAAAAKPVITKNKNKTLPPIPLKLDDGNKSARKPPKVAVRKSKKEATKVCENIDLPTPLVPAEVKPHVVLGPRPKSPLDILMSMNQTDKQIVTSKASVAQKRALCGFDSLMPCKQRRIHSPVNREKLALRPSTTECKVIMRDIISIRTERTGELSPLSRRRALSPLNHGIPAKTGSFLGCGRSVSDLNSSNAPLDVTERKPSYNLQKGHTDFSIASLTATPATQTRPCASEVNVQSSRMSHTASKPFSNDYKFQNDSAKYQNHSLLNNSQSSQSSNCGKDLSRNFNSSMNSSFRSNQTYNTFNSGFNNRSEPAFNKINKTSFDKSSEMYEVKASGPTHHNNSQTMSHNDSGLDLRKHKAGTVLDMRIPKQSTPKSSALNSVRTQTFNGCSDPGVKMPPKHHLSKQLSQKTQNPPQRGYHASQKVHTNGRQNFDYNFPTVNSMKSKLKTSSVAAVAPTFSSTRNSKVTAVGNKRPDPSPRQSQSMFVDVDEEGDSMYPRGSNYKKINQPPPAFKQREHRDSGRGLKLAASTLAQYNHSAEVRKDHKRAYAQQKPAAQATVRPINHQQAGPSTGGQVTADRQQLLMNMMVANNPYLWNAPKTPQQLAAHATLEQRRKHELECRIASLELWRQRVQAVDRAVLMDPRLGLEQQALFNQMIASDPNLQHMLGASSLQSAVGDNSMQASAAFHLSLHAQRKQEEELQKQHLAHTLMRQQQQLAAQQVLHPDHLASLVHAQVLAQHQLQAKQAEEYHQMKMHHQMMQQPAGGASGQAAIPANLINLSALQASMYPHHP